MPTPSAPAEADLPPAAPIALDRAPVDTRGDPQWYRDAVIYQLNVKAFYDTNGDGVGDFKGVTARLDYVKELGVNTIWLMPFYPSPLRDDGYDIAEYKAVNPQYGTLEDFKEMLDAAHARSLRVVTELVINHTSDQHPWFQRARRAPAGSPERDFYVWSDTDQIYQGTRIIFTDTETSNWSWDPVARQFFWHRFFSHQPDLNFDNPAVMEAVLDVMRFWLDLGVDGFRLDAIPYLVERDGTSNENLPETHAVIKRLRAAVDAEYEGRFLLAEANMWPEDVREYFGEGDECHMCYHFPLMPRMYMAIAQEDRFPIMEIMQQTPDIPPGCQWAIFLRNHDELTLEMVTSRERDYMYGMYAADKRARINLGIRRRLAPLMENDTDRVKLMNGMLLSMPGSPIIYYGDEIGMGDNVYVGDRNGVRTPMQWTPERNAGFSTADPQSLYLQPIVGPLYGYEARNVEAQARDASSLLNWTRRMLAVRATSRAFGRGRRTFLKPGNRKILAYVTDYVDDNTSDRILCVFNLSRAAQAVELDLSAHKGRVPVEMLGHTSFPPVGDLPYLLTLPSFGFFWLRLSATTETPAWHQEVLPLQETPVLVLFDGWASFMRERVQPTRLAMAERIRAQFETEVLPRYIGLQRWYAGKGAPIAEARVADQALWELGDAAWLLPLVDVQDGAGARAPYFVPLALAWEEGEEERYNRLMPAGVARIRQQARVGVLADAFSDEPFCRSLVGAMRDGATLPTSAGGTLRFSGTQALAGLQIEPEALPVARPGGLSSNTVVALGEALFVKGYRRLRAGVNPELEMGRFLTDVAQFQHCVPVLGALEYVDAAGTPSTLAILQAYVANQGDGWQLTLGYLERFLTAQLAIDAPATSGAQDEHGGFLTLATTLGERTAQMHAALRTPSDDPAFAPEPFTEADAARSRARAVDGAAAALALLEERLPGLLPEVQADARRLLDRAPALQEHLQRIPLAAGGWKTRYHGDYHLGQVLVTGHDFVIIDFEGEPLRSFEERRAKASPLRDVAGMLRSFDYARWAALRRVARNAEDVERMAPALAQWEQATRTVFLRAYGDALPPDSAPVDPALLALFTLEKACYELRYELDNRPDWVHVPLRGILAALD